MQKSVFARAAVVALALGLVSVVRADEKSVKESEVPKPCVESVRKKYPTAELKGFTKEEEDGKVTYEIQIEVRVKVKQDKERVRSIDIDLSPEGKILAEEETIEKDDLPAAVKKGLESSKYGKWDCKRVERIVHDEKDAEATYEIVVTNGEKKFEIVLDKDGKITKEEEKKVKPKGGKEDEDD